MTIFYPDISNHQAGLKLQPHTVAVCAKASQGTTFRDPTYAGFRTQAAGVGAFFFAYHWLLKGNAEAQARFCHDIVGQTPVMIDCELDKDAPASVGVPTVSDCLAFASALRARGGVCSLVYLPHWYWQDHLGSPNLAPLSAAGLGLVSSNYTRYSDTGPGWNPYGGMTPVIWQYTDALPYGGKKVDFNAYRGSVDQLKALVTGQVRGRVRPV